MNDTPSPLARFIVRKGSTDWMVYDRKLKGPAQLKKNGSFAEKLTKEEAEHVKQVLTDDLTVQSGQL